MKCISPKLIWPHRSVEWQDANEDLGMQVPCGKCLACLSNKRQEWIFRLEQEHKFSRGSLFVTLTYDEKHNPHELRKRDLQLYMKRLRKADGTNKVRYYGVGEYGEKGGRPHYHVLLFNCSRSVVSQSWSDINGKPIGMVHIGDVTQASIAYCTKYIVQTVGEWPYNLQKPFTLMSRGYGIGARYLSDEMVTWHKDNKASYSVNSFGIKCRLSRFYKSKIWYDEQERSDVSKAALERSIVQDEKTRKFFSDRYGDAGPSKYIELRDAMLSRIKTKVAYTQTL